MSKKALLVMVFVFLVSRSAFAGHYIADNRITYIGETEQYHCYIYDFDVNLVIRFSDFHKSGNWSATVSLKPKQEKIRQAFIQDLSNDVNSGSFNTIVMPNGDNKFWAYAQRFIFDKQQNKLFLKDDFWLNDSGEIIATTRTEYIESKELDYPKIWQIKDLMDKHIHKRYKDEYERRNTLVR